LFGIFSPTRVSTFSISLRISSQSDSVLVWPVLIGDTDVPLLYPMSRLSKFFFSSVKIYLAVYYVCWKWKRFYNLKKNYEL
jgi:hypothetical protein